MTFIIRTLTILLITASLVLLVIWRLGHDRQQRAIDELTAANQQMEQQLEQRKAMIERLSRSRRLAHIEITAQRVSAAHGLTETDVLFIEVDDNGRELGRQSFTITGDVLFVDALTVKFDHEFVAHGHPLYGRTLVLLRRIYSDRIAPVNGLPIDTPGAIPPGYAGSEHVEFERMLWEDFWKIATDAETARRFGVRVAQGEAVYKPVRAGQKYELIVDAAGGMSLVPTEL
jgi:hypothetical protein